jgi:zinc protease
MYKRIVWSLFLVALLALPAQAQKYGITSKTLDIGLEVIVIENHSLPILTIEIAVKNGAFTEPPELDGLSHLYEHMFFKANRTIPSQEAYLARQRELGMVWNGTTSNELVNYFFTLHKNDLKDGMVFMRDAIRYPLFKQDELERERPVVLGEFDRNEASPYFHWGQAVSHLMWSKYFSRKNVIGDREVISTATQEKMQTIQNRYYIPNNSALIVSGDVVPAQIFAMAQELFGDWPKGDDPFAKFPIPEHPPLDSSSFVTVIQPVNAVMIMKQWHGPSMRDDVKATFAADVFSFIIQQPNSRFQKMLVDSGLVDGVGLSYQSLVHTGPITLQARTDAGRYERAMAAINDEIQHFADADYFTDDQLAFAKNQLEISEIYNQEETSTFSHSLAFWWSTGGLDYYLNYIDNLRAVSRADIAAYVNRYILGKNSVTGILASQQDAEKLGLAGGM